MATYTATAATAGYPVRADMDGDTFTIIGSISLTTALAVNDVVNLVSIPNGYAVVGVTLDCTQLDSNATPTLAGSVQDTAGTQTFISAATKAGNSAAGSVQIQNVGGSTGYTYAVGTGGNPGLTTLQFKCGTAAATWKNGTMLLAVELQQNSAQAGAPFA